MTKAITFRMSDEMFHRLNLASRVCEQPVQGILTEAANTQLDLMFNDRIFQSMLADTIAKDQALLRSDG